MGYNSPLGPKGSTYYLVGIKYSKKIGFLCTDRPLIRALGTKPTHASVSVTEIRRVKKWVKILKNSFALIAQLDL